MSSAVNFKTMATIITALVLHDVVKSNAARGWSGREGPTAARFSSMPYYYIVCTIRCPLSGLSATKA
jgi:hypothetical protein